jgi:hypothetical protein
MFGGAPPRRMLNSVSLWFIYRKDTEARRKLIYLISSRALDNLSVGSGGLQRARPDPHLVE